MDNYCRDSKHSHHYIVNILPLIVICKPSGNPGAYLTQHHKEKVDGWHTYRLLGIHLVPTSFIFWLISRRKIVCGLYMKSVLYKGKEVAHKQRLPYETHYQTAERKYEDTLCNGADVTEYKEYDKAPHHHKLLPSEAYKGVEEWGEGRHTHRGDKTHK